MAHVGVWPARPRGPSALRGRSPGPAGTGRRRRV